MTAAILVAVYLVAILVWLLADSRSESALYKRDERNPARRYCTNCDQCQVFTQWAADYYAGKNPGWWVTQGEVFNPDCACHKDTE